MKSFATFILLILAIFFVSCISKNQSLDAVIEKVWQYDEYIDSVYIYRKGSNINDDKEGLQFLSEGKLKVRQNSGWCGTAPVLYKTVLGSWNPTSDSTIKMEYPYWGGRIIDSVLIIKISNTELQIRTIKLQRLHSKHHTTR